MNTPRKRTVTGGSRNRRLQNRKPDASARGDHVVISSDKFDAVLFDMDGVVTRTALIHMAAWRETFDKFLEAKCGPHFKPFTEQDYRQYVDGKAREDGVRSFLQSRKIRLRVGTADDKAGFTTISAIGTMKNKTFLKLLHKQGVEVYETTVGLIRSLKARGVKVALISASKNMNQVLKAANLTHLFDTRVDGIDAVKKKLPGKPAPDVFLQAARQLNVSPERAVVVEDALAGVEAGAKGRFGMVIGVARNDNVSSLKRHGATAVVQDLGEVTVSGKSSLATKQPKHAPGSALTDLDVTDDNWILKHNSYSAKLEGQRESVCAIGNGYFCTRGAAPESKADGVHYPGTYLAGLYNRLISEIEGKTLDQEEVVNVQNWMFVSFRIGNDPWLNLGDAEILNYEQRLNLREGVLYRKFKIRDSEKRETTVSQRMFVHMRYSHLAGIETSLTAENWSGTLTLRSAIDGQVKNAGTRKDARLSSKHLVPVEGTVNGDTLYLKMMTNQSHISVAMAARNTLLCGSETIEAVVDDIIQEDLVAQDMKLTVAEGKTVTLEKIASVYTTRDRAISEAGTAALSAVGQADDFCTLLKSQICTWRHLWDQFDLFIETTQEHSKIVPSLLLHLHTFHALQTASPNIKDLDCGIPARGWTGEGYQGHVFWDDLFIFPFINFRMPHVTQSLLRYRYRRLNPARELAKQLGAKGARFPWQSGSTGQEDTPTTVWIPEKKKWDPDNSHLQIHVTAAIAYNIWQYYQVTTDLDFVHAYGAEMFLEIARFFATYSKFNKAKNRYEILGVMGPDEYHNGYPDADKPGIDNNAYTNVMAVWVLSNALEMLKIMPSDHREEICQRIALTAEEIDTWDTISRRMFVPILDNGLINQFEGYDKLNEFEWRNNGALNMNRLTDVLHEQGLVLNQYKVSKQADVLMLFYVFSVDELKDLFSRLGYRFHYSMIAKNIEYYLPRTANTSTLSRVAHAWVLARFDRIRSWKLIKKMYPHPSEGPWDKPDDVPHSWNTFMEALGTDLYEVQGGSTTREGIHMAAMAGTLDIVQRCYAGLVTREDVLWLSPQLPDALTRLSFTIHYRDQALAFEITHKSVKVTAHHCSAQVITLGFKEQTYELNAGESLEFKLNGRQSRSQAA